MCFLVQNAKNLQLIYACMAISWSQQSVGNVHKNIEHCQDSKRVPEDMRNANKHLLTVEIGKWNILS